MGLVPAQEPCPGPTGRSRVRVVAGPIEGEDPALAFRPQPMLAWVVELDVVAVESGPFEGEELAVVVHSPSMFAGELWGFMASPDSASAGLELQWRPEYCMYEITGIEQAEPAAPEHGELQL